MRHVIIGTAGHIDHGKTCLIKALTGTDTDRLKEEKKRGITIELGFASLTMEDGSRAGIVDVPGHEKFIKNMLAGAGGIDIAMLVVAADEGVMPQTVEHLDILSILGIKKGIIVITKTDLTGSELAEMAAEEVKELAKGTFLEDASVAYVSAHTGAGIEELKHLLLQMCRELPERAKEKYFRLPIDRVFSLKGFGTIVTGTLSEGTLDKKQEVMLYPEEVPVKIRNLQVHSQDEEKGYAGQRVAVNLAGVKKEEIQRGDVLAPKGSFYPSMMIDVRLEMLKHASKSVKHGSRVHFYHGTQESVGKVVLMEKEELTAGECGYAQIRLESSGIFKKGDHFVIRFYSPVETVGGGVILNASPKKHRKNHQKTVNSFSVWEKGSSMEQLEEAFREHWGSFYTLDELAMRHFLNRQTLKNDCRKLAEEKKVFAVSEKIYIHREELEYYEKQAAGYLKEFHKKNPLQEGMSREELRSRLGLAGKGQVADAVIEILKGRKILKEKDHLLSAWKFQIVVKEDEHAVMEKIENDYRTAGFAPLATEVYLHDNEKGKNFRYIYNSMLNKKILIRLDKQYCVHRDWYAAAREKFRELAADGRPVVLGEYRDYLECSRKVAVALLEHFDKNGFTYSVEGGRILK